MQLLMVLDGSSFSSHMYEVAHYFIVVHINAFKKNVG